MTHDDERFDVGAAQARTLVLEPGWAERHYWRDLWTYRELFLILSWRDAAVRYKLGRHTPFSHHGDLHHGVRSATFLKLGRQCQAWA